MKALGLASCRHKSRLVATETRHSERQIRWGGVAEAVPRSELLPTALRVVSNIVKVMAWKATNPIVNYDTGVAYSLVAIKP